MNRRNDRRSERINRQKNTISHQPIGLPTKVWTALEIVWSPAPVNNCIPDATYWDIPADLYTPTYSQNGPTNARLYPSGGQTTPTMTVDDIWSKVCRPNRPILFPTGRMAEPISPTHCRGWQPTSDFHKAPDQATVFSSRHPMFRQPNTDI